MNKKMCQRRRAQRCLYVPHNFLIPCASFCMCIVSFENKNNRSSMMAPDTTITWFWPRQWVYIILLVGLCIIGILDESGGLLRFDAASVTSRISRTTTSVAGDVSMNSMDDQKENDDDIDLNHVASYFAPILSDVQAFIDNRIRSCGQFLVQIFLKISEVSKAMWTAAASSDDDVEFIDLFTQYSTFTRRNVTSTSIRTNGID
jgi:hypothetical protein